jgi:hypothetical protein
MSKEKLMDSNFFRRLHFMPDHAFFRVQPRRLPSFLNQVEVEVMISNLMFDR